MRVASLWLVVFPACATAGPPPPAPGSFRAAALQDSSVPAQLPDPDADYPSAFYVPAGFLLGVRGHGSRLGGDFDGDTTLTGPDTIFLSDTDDGLGWEVLAGGMNSQGESIEVGYTRIHYEGEFAGVPGDVDYRAFELRLVHYWRANEPVQPLAQIGVLVPLADIEDGSSDGLNVGNAKLRGGFGFEVGGGFAWWLTHRFALDVRAQTTFQWFGQAEGVADDPEEIDDPVYAPSYGVSIGLVWVPGGRR